MDNLSKTQKEILYTAVEMFEESIRVSLLSLEFMEKNSEGDKELKNLNDSGYISQEKEVANDLLSDIRIIKIELEKSIDTKGPEDIQEPQWK